MATPRKVSKVDQTSMENEISGYLHDVSPIKTSKKNNLYFDGTIQTGRDEYKHFVCFDTTKQNAFRNAAEADKSPIKLQQISLVPSQREANSSDVLVKKVSTLEVKKSLTFSFKARKIADSTAITTITKCQEMPAYNKVSVIAKVLELKEEESKEVRNAPMPFRKAIIADNTGSITLSLWSDHVLQVEEGKVYSFTNVATRYFETHSLTTTPSTLITISDTILDIPTLTAAHPTENTIIGTINNVVIKKTMQCTNCRKAISPEPDQPIIRCIHCSMKQHTKNITSSFHGKLNVSSNSHTVKLTVFHVPLFKYLSTCKEQAISEDAEEIEDLLLSAEPLKFIYSQDYIVSCMSSE